MLKSATATYSGMIDKYKTIDMTELDGFYNDVLIYLQNRMGFIPVIILAKPDAQFNELVDGVANDLFDTVMSSIIITEQRNSIVDFSVTLLPSSIRVIIRKPTSIQLDFFFFFKPFSWKLWLLILGTLLYSSILLWYFQWQNHRRLRNNFRNGIGRIISYTVHTLLNRGASPIIFTRAGRFLTFGLYILQIILFAAYTANLVSFIIIQNSGPAISGIDDIKNGKIPPYRLGIIEGSAIESFYLNVISQRKKDYYSLRTVDEIFTSLINGDIDAALWSNHSIAYHINNKYCDLMTVGVEFSHSTYQLPVKKDWLYKAELDSNILALIDSQELDRIAVKWFLQRHCSETNKYDAITKLITIEAMAGLFIIFFIISIIAILMNFWSTIISFIRKNIIDKIHTRPVVTAGNRAPHVDQVSSVSTSVRL